MTAASSDNVQVLAMVACERFGNTLAMRSETTDKVERILLPSPEPAPISFLKATVGFFPNDCATQIGKSASGVRFLGLAAALVTSLGPFEAAKSIDLMLKETTKDLTILPTVRNLKDLLGSLDARSQRCGFADSVVGWQILLRQEVLPRIFTGQARLEWDSTELDNMETTLLQTTPSPEAIAGLVDVFRQVARMGLDTVLGATIVVGAAAPWVLAFAQWCVEPPSLFVGGKPVVEPPGSRIKVAISAEAADIGSAFSYTIHHQLEKVSRLLGPPSRTLTTGMVSLESYRAWLFQELGFADTMMFRVLREALEHAIPQVLRHLRGGRFAFPDQDAGSERSFEGGLDSMRYRYCPRPPPDMRAIADASARLLGLNDPVQFAYSDGRRIAELPLVSQHFKAVAIQCRCDGCQDPSSMSQAILTRSRCPRDRFFTSLSFIIMDIFALSLLDSPSPLLVRPCRDREAGRKMQLIIAETIRTGYSLTTLDEMDLLGWARHLIGHKFNGEGQGLIATSGKGQVVFPYVFDTFHIEKQGSLKLCCLPGVLSHQDATYDAVTCHDPATAPSGSHPVVRESLSPPGGVPQPFNSFRDFSLSWRISAQDNRELLAELSLGQGAKRSVFLTLDINPLWVLRALKNTLLVDDCPHDHRAPLTSPDDLIAYTSPWDQPQWRGGTAPHVDIVPIDGADDLRCFAVAFAVQSVGVVVLRRNSCLACCLDVCRRERVSVLVL